MMRLDEHNNTGRDYRRARALRNDPSPFENKLWVLLRERAKIPRLKFGRRQPIHPFIADFACMEARLLIELDGASHDTRLDDDKARDEKPKQTGCYLLRFRNQDVVENLEHAVETIVDPAVRLIKNKPRNSPRRSPLPNSPLMEEGTSAFPMADQG